MNAETIEQVILNLPAEIAVLVRGEHGIGKSQLGYRVAQNLKLPFVDVRASTMQEGDVVGYPDLEKIKDTGVSSFALPSWFMRASREPVVIMLDELNRALPSVMNSFFQVILDRCLGNGPDGLPIYLHPQTRVIAAVNTGNNYSISEMDSALLDRFWIADLTVETSQWISWAEKNELSPVLIDFIRNHPEHLRETNQVESGTITPSMRSWDRLNRSLKGKDLVKNGAVNDMVYAIASGFVGPDAASSLVSFIKNYKFIVQAEDILNNPDIISKINFDDAENVTTLVRKLTSHAAENEWTAQQCSNVHVFFNNLNPELQMFFFSKIIGCKHIENMLKIRDLVKDRIIEIQNQADIKTST